MPWELRKDFKIYLYDSIKNKNRIEDHDQYFMIFHAIRGYTSYKLD